MVLVDLNLDGIRCVKLASLKVDFECRLGSSSISSMEVVDEEVCDISRHESECGGKESVTWLKVELWILSWEVDSLEAWDVESHFLKVRKMSFSLEEILFGGRLKIDLK